MSHINPMTHGVVSPMRFLYIYGSFWIKTHTQSAKNYKIILFLLPKNNFTLVFNVMRIMTVKMIRSFSSPIRSYEQMLENFRISSFWYSKIIFLIILADCPWVLSVYLNC